MTVTAPLPHLPASSDRVLADPVQVTIGARVTIASPTDAPREATGKAGVLLALLGVEAGVERRRAAALLWPESAEEQARNNLRTLVHRLNGSIGSTVVAGNDRLGLTGARVNLVPGSADAVLAALAAQGPRECELLSDLDEATHGPDLSAWVQAARQRLRQRQLQLLRDALAQAEADSDAPRARALAQAWVQLDPFSEQGHRQLMKTLAHFGDRAAALATYERLKGLLRDQLGVSPDRQTRAVHLRILQDQAFDPATARTGDDAPTAVLPAGALPSHGQAVPGASAGYALVERDAVLDQLRGALASGRHAVIEGEAGVGKSRLLRALTDAMEGVRHVGFFSGDRHQPYAALNHLLHTVQPHVGAQVPPAAQTELARVARSAFPDAPPTEAPLSALRLHEALRQWFHALGGVGVHLLVLDDLHCADTASQAALASLLETSPDGPGAPPLCLLAHRSGEIETLLSEAMSRTQLAHRTLRVTLPRLSLDGVRSLLKAMGADAREAAQYWQRSGGNPLFLIELAQHVLESGESVAEASNAGLDALLRSRLRGCSELAQQLACVAAIASPELTVELAATVLDRPLLALMPPWHELQCRGLFADHGLAHDLVRDAALGSMPPLIARSLQARVAAELENQGERGARVMRHWMAASQPDRALPHAAHQLHAVSRAGLSTRQLELDLIDLMGAVSDAVLLDNLWLTGEVGSNVVELFALREVWPRLKHLLDRVKTLPTSRDTAAWIAYESARQCFHVDRMPKPAYDLLIGALEHLPGHGLARARVEHQLAVCGHQVVGAPSSRAHARHALQAMAHLPEDLSHRRLRLAVQELDHFNRGTLNVVRAKRVQLRAAQQSDPAAAFEACLQMATAHQFDSNPYRAFRHYSRAARCQGNDLERGVPIENPNVGIAAYMTGRYDIALKCFAQCQDDFKDHQSTFLAVVWWRLGDIAKAEHHLDQARPEHLQGRFLPELLHSDIRAQVDEAKGVDPLPALRRAHERMVASGVSGTNLAKMAWRLSLRERSAAERWVEGRQLTEQLAMEGIKAWTLMIDVAEAGAEAGIDPKAWMPLLREAARGLRRGHGETSRYNPEGLVRCARLLQAIDPVESLSLLDVARRRVLDALPHVPAEARDSFRAVPVHAQLLADGLSTQDLPGGMAPRWDDVQAERGR